MSTRILLVRHGETDWNAQERIQGRHDIPLNQRGLDQARKLGERLRSETIAGVYTSPQQRAVATAQAIASHHPTVPLVHLPQLAEFSFGPYDGMRIPDFKSKLDWNRIDDEEYRLSIGAEPKGPTREWIQNHLSEIFLGHRGETILLSTHGAKKKFLLETLLNEADKEASIRAQHPNNCSLTILHWHPQEGVSLELYNDTSHLDMLG